jgi:hypothetical protein
MENDNFCIDLESSTGEKLFIVGEIRGVGADHQYTGIYNERKSIDLNDCVYGLAPFIYSFRNDTLSLFFYHTAVKYPVKEKFESIKFNYVVISNEDEWLRIQSKAQLNDYYYNVPNSIND